MAAAAQNAIQHILPHSLRCDKEEDNSRREYSREFREHTHSSHPKYPLSDTQRYSQQQQQHLRGRGESQSDAQHYHHSLHHHHQQSHQSSQSSREASHHAHSSHQLHHNRSDGKSRQRELEQEREEEKSRIANLSDEFFANGPMEIDQVMKDPRDKIVGHSSRSLRQEDFDLMRTLGTGTFARVWLVRLAKSQPRDQDKVFALKVLRKVDVIRLKQVEHVRNERNVLAVVAGHPFITTMITSFQDRDSLYMLLDYCPGGEVFSYLRRARRFNEPTSQFYAAEIVLILEFLHEKEGVAYRDLKPENILIDAEGHLKLVDFGFAKRIYNRETYTLCGTPEYLAPEVIRNTGHGCAVDWWAFGILVYEFLVGQPPFWDQNPMKIYEQIVEGRVRYPSAMSSNARDIISKLCTVDTSKRLGNISGGAGAIKAHPWFSDIDWEGLYHRRIKGPIIPHLRGPADTRNFDEYDPEPEGRATYTEELERKWDDAFADF